MADSDMLAALSPPHCIPSPACVISAREAFRPYRVRLRGDDRRMVNTFKCIQSSKLMMRMHASKISACPLCSASSTRSSIFPVKALPFQGSRLPLRPRLDVKRHVEGANRSESGGKADTTTKANEKEAQHA